MSETLFSCKRSLGIAYIYARRQPKKKKKAERKMSLGILDRGVQFSYFVFIHNLSVSSLTDWTLPMFLKSRLVWFYPFLLTSCQKCASDVTLMIIYPISSQFFLFEVVGMTLAIGQATNGNEC